MCCIWTANVDLLQGEDCSVRACRVFPHDQNLLQAQESTSGDHWHFDALQDCAWEPSLVDCIQTPEKNYAGDACEDLLADKHDFPKYRWLGRRIPGLRNGFPYAQNQ
jgi:hypothetical protein